MANFDFRRPLGLANFDFGHFGPFFMILGIFGGISGKLEKTQKFWKIQIFLIFQKILKIIKVLTFTGYFYSKICRVYAQGCLQKLPPLANNGPFLAENGPFLSKIVNFCQKLPFSAKNGHKMTPFDAHLIHLAKYGHF